ncbi:alpha/beta hydrolase [Phytomonospora sp. NPDC050363]|uniref:alpha/beta hydrolase n=1 Tax=Phytomonospora sp. NPDC050363 TaxID=3155642 RepID=UPI0033EC657D
MTTAELHDGNTVELTVQGTGPTVLLPVDPAPADPAKAEELRRWGMDPELGRTLVNGLADVFTVVAFPYEAHVMAHPKPATLTPANIAADFLAVADAAGAARFAYYGYSWLALSGLQLALRTDRLDALVMGGFPPQGGPYAEMLRVTNATHDMSGGTPKPPAAPSGGEEFDWSAAEVTLSKDQTRQFVTLYEALDGFDDRAAQSRLTLPRLCFAGSADTIVYGEKWGGVTVDIAGATNTNRPSLEAAGWEVEILDGLDHTAAMQPGNALPVLRPWLEARLTG